MLSPLQSPAGSGLLTIKNAELSPDEDGFKLNASFDVTLSPPVEEALNKGVPLTFLVEFQLLIPHKYWFDDEIVTTSTKITLNYHALSRQYLLTQMGRQQTFATLAEAKEALSQLHDWQVVEKSLLKKDEMYEALLRIRLDHGQLPKPLQVEALASENWNLISPRHRWLPGTLHNLLGP